MTRTEKIEKIVISMTLDSLIALEPKKALVFRCCGGEQGKIEVRGFCPRCGASNTEVINKWKFDLIQTIIREV